MGWKEAALESDILGKYNQFEEDYWDILRQGFNLNDAVNESLPPAGGTRIWENFAAYGVSSRQQAAGYPPVKTKVARIKKALIEALAQTGRQSAIPENPGKPSLSIFMRLGFLLWLFLCNRIRLGFGHFLNFSGRCFLRSSLLALNRWSATTSNRLSS